MSERPQIITLEEHYWDSEIAATYPQRPGRPDIQGQRLLNIGDGRLRDMDDAGIDMQILSHSTPGVQRMPREGAVRLAAQANERLFEDIQGRLDRFRAFATLPTPDPEASARELERAVTQFGFLGTLINGLTLVDDSKLVFFDDERFAPIHETAQRLDVPIYLHPGELHPDVRKAYFEQHMERYPIFARSGWGYNIDASTHAVSMILSNTLEKYPNLRFILGHQGEGLPFFLDRAETCFNKDGNENPVPFRARFTNNFWITTSGNFSTPALRCSIDEMGIDRVLFSVDYPYEVHTKAVEWGLNVPLNPENKEKFLSGNARALLKLP